ncbi:MAG: ABC transporter permease, partial [Sphaerospermopsis sp. SIO1G2]|nr:ABC transporter permease [Sphaerospermopsis sp. SIO1G2]
FLYQLGSYPSDKYPLTGEYCLLSPIYNHHREKLYQQQSVLNNKLSNYQKIELSDPTIIPNLKAQLQQVNTQLSDIRDKLYKTDCPPNEINWQMWWQDHWGYIFLTFSVVFIFILLVAGTYLLISDLAKEENKGTLNFIRLSPQTETSILGGKILGVPSLVYLFVLTAIPLHFWAGKSANIAASYIFGYYAILITCCGFFYSAALLFGLVSRWFSGFQPWLGSGGVLLFLSMTMAMADSSYNNDFNTPVGWLRILSPWDITNYLFPNLFNLHKGLSLESFQFFYIPIGQNATSLVGFYLVNYGIVAYGIWQVIKRCFRNPDITILSKKQSYIITAFTQFMFLGFMMQESAARHYETVPLFLVLNAILITGLIFINSPVRQNIQDWARYRHQNNSHKSLLQDLLFGEKSPAIIAIGVNLIIAATPLVIWVIALPKDLQLNSTEQNQALLGIVISITMMLIYASIAQLMLLMKNPKRYLWAVGTVGAVITFPPVILSVLRIYPGNNAAAWLFSSFPWPAIDEATISTMFMALLFDFTVVALLNWRFNKRVQVLGESATKALLASR